MKPKSPWLVRPKAVSHPKLRLFCFPYAGGGAAAFRRWPELLPQWIEVIAIQPPGREGRFTEPLATDVRAIGEAIAAAMKPWMDLPCAIFGHSLGTLTGFQTAQELRRGGCPVPVAMVMSGRGAPHLAWQRCERYRLPHDEFIAEVRNLQGTPEEVLASDELMELLIPILRADFALNATYDPGQQRGFDCPLFAYGGTTDPEVSEDDLAQWQKYSSRPVQVRMFEGGHFYVEAIREQVLQQLAKDLEACMH